MTEELLELYWKLYNNGGVIYQHPRQQPSSIIFPQETKIYSQHVFLQYQYSKAYSSHIMRELRKWFKSHERLPGVSRKILPHSTRSTVLQISLSKKLGLLHLLHNTSRDTTESGRGLPVLHTRSLLLFCHQHQTISRGK
jgi:hypothetical protein